MYLTNHIQKPDQWPTLKVAIDEIIEVNKILFLYRLNILKVGPIRKNICEIDLEYNFIVSHSH